MSTGFHTMQRAGTRGTVPSRATKPIALVIDDDTALQGLLAETLTEHGFAVAGFDAPPAVEDVARLQPDLVLLDLVFGDAAEGQTWLRRVREHPATIETTVIVCTGMRQRAADPALRAQCHGVLLKPFAVDELTALVARTTGITA